MKALKAVEQQETQTLLSLVQDALDNLKALGSALVSEGVQDESSKLEAFGRMVKEQTEKIWDSLEEWEAR